MKVLVIGSGAREHAIALAIAKSPRLSALYVAPGNPGTAAIACNVSIDIADQAAIVAFCRSESIGFVVIGPEGPLVAGLADDLRQVGIACFGPGRDAAKLEGSKGFTKDFCREFAIPTGDFARFSSADEAIAYIGKQSAPIVVKADGLAAGKGVVIAMTHAEAERAVRDMLGGAFGAAGAEVVVEEFLPGEEVSFFALCDGRRAAPFGSAQDHKRVGEGDTGPNTGGMGAYSPVAMMDEAMTERVMREIIAPTVAGMAARGMPFRGFLFAGLMIGEAGPKLIEYNVRLGDPEAEVLLARLEGDLLELLLACEQEGLPERAPAFSPQAALAVIFAARGYPGPPMKGTPINGVERAESLPGVAVLHAGTRNVGEGLVADGGRVLAVTALGADVSEAQARAYAAIDAIDWPGGFCRRDIGWRAIEREKAEEMR
jgi:phosphoribosylamine---glycine ligase